MSNNKTWHLNNETDNWKLEMALWCSGYHYCTTSFNKAWSQVLRRFKSCSQHFGDSQWWDLWQWLLLEIRLNAFRWSTIPQKQFFIIIIIIVRIKRLVLVVIIFFNCYFAAPQQTLGHYRGDSLTNLMFITAFVKNVTESLLMSLVPKPSCVPSEVWTRNLPILIAMP